MSKGYDAATLTRATPTSRTPGLGPAHRHPDDRCTSATPTTGTPSRAIPRWRRAGRILVVPSGAAAVQRHRRLEVLRRHHLARPRRASRPAAAARKFCPNGNRDARPDGELPRARARPAGHGPRLLLRRRRRTSTRPTSTASPRPGSPRGCADGRFCPNGLVTRAQMATFLSQGPRPAAGRADDYFTDDDDNQPRGQHQPLRGGRRSPSGCGRARYCPDGLVTRGQMAAFLHRALDCRHRPPPFGTAADRLP